MSWSGGGSGLPLAAMSWFVGAGQELLALVRHLGGGWGHPENDRDNLVAIFEELLCET